MEQDRSTYTRVTEIIGYCSRIDRVPEEILKPAAERGTLTHRYIEQYLKGEEIHVVPDVVQPYLDSFKIFWERSSHAWDLDSMELEKRFWCDKYRITGQVDCIIRGGNKTYLMDWKTSAQFHPSFFLQGAAYRYLADEAGYTNTDALMFVRLNKEGKKPTLHKPETYLEDLGTFFKCLDVYRFFNKQ